MPVDWLSMETTRSRRSSKIFWNLGMKSCGPFKASTAAHCEMEVALVADWLCSLAIALISSRGPAA